MSRKKKPLKLIRELLGVRSDAGHEIIEDPAGSQSNHLRPGDAALDQALRVGAIPTRVGECQSCNVEDIHGQEGFIEYAQVDG